MDDSRSLALRSVERMQANGASLRAARALGWFSLALGVGELLMPRTLGRAVGYAGPTAFVRACGVREIITGLGILSSRNPAPWLWARVAGDALDLASLAPLTGEKNAQRGAAALALGAVAGVTALDVKYARQCGAQTRAARVTRDYSDRSGLPRTPEAMRGAARALAVPRSQRRPSAQEGLQRQGEGEPFIGTATGTGARAEV